MTELSLFSGAGGGLLGTKLLGFRCVGYVEANGYRREVIRQRVRDGYLDDAPIWPDVRTFDGRPFRGRVGIVTAGFPCTPAAAPGKRRGRDDPRYLWPDTYRIIRECEPAAVLVENSPRVVPIGIANEVVDSLARAGFDAEWDYISAREVGADHERRRFYLIATHPDRIGLWQQSRRWRRPHGEDSLFASRDGAYGHAPSAREGFAQPGVCRANDGIPCRMDRLAAAGDAQVPRVVVEAFYRLTS